MANNVKSKAGAWEILQDFVPGYGYRLWLSNGDRVFPLVVYSFQRDRKQAWASDFGYMPKSVEAMVDRFVARVCNDSGQIVDAETVAGLRNEWGL